MRIGGRESPGGGTMGRRPLKGRARSDFTSGDIPEAPDSPPIVAFDFDGTLTVRDSFTSFLKWRAGPARYNVGMVRLTPSALAYLVDHDRGRIKAAAAKEFLYGVPREQLEEEVREFAKQCAQDLLRADAVATFRWWRQRGAVTAIVTASPDIVVAPFSTVLVSIRVRQSPFQLSSSCCS